MASIVIAPTDAPNEDLEIEDGGTGTLLGPDEENVVIKTTQATTGRMGRWSVVQIFLCGFCSNAFFVLAVVVCRRASVSPAKTVDSGRINAAEFPLFLNDTAAFKYLLDNNGGFRYSKDYFLLQQGNDAQTNQAYCGVASVAAVLNSFGQEINLPVDWDYTPYKYATQEDIFSECVTSSAILHDDEFDGILASPFGLGMAQIQAMLACFFRPEQKWEVQATSLDPLEVSLDQMREHLIHYLRTDEARVLVNFERSAVHEEGGGHWSPLASYNCDIDAFLVLDVAKYKYGPFWISTSLLYEAMATIDGCGRWDFPLAQKSLPDDLLYPASSTDYEKATEQLDCMPTYRGFVVVKRSR